MTEKVSRLERNARLGWVPLSKIRVRPEGQGQREFREHWSRKLAASFDPEKFGVPLVSESGGYFYVIDGNHRMQAYKMFLGDGSWEFQSVQCWIYRGLTIAQEAEMFLGSNETKHVDAFAKYKNAVQAGRKEESTIEDIARLNRIKVARSGEGTLSCPTTMLKVHRRGDGVLARTLKIVVGAFGDAGLESIVIDGFGNVCARYNGDFQDEVAIKQLSEMHGGVGGLLGKATILKKQTGASMPHCVAATAVEVINRGLKKKLPNWWKKQAGGEAR